MLKILTRTSLNINTKLSIENKRRKGNDGQGWILVAQVYSNLYTNSNFFQFKTTSCIFSDFQRNLKPKLIEIITNNIHDLINFKLKKFEFVYKLYINLYIIYILLGNQDSALIVIDLFFVSYVVMLIFIIEYREI